MNSIEEGWFSDVLDTIKKSDTIKDIKKKFKELTGVDFDKKEESGEVTNEYKSYKIIEPSDQDIKFYKKILEKIEAPITKENMAFFYAWRQAEGAKSSYNPYMN